MGTDVVVVEVLGRGRGREGGVGNRTAQNGRTYVTLLAWHSTNASTVVCNVATSRCGPGPSYCRTIDNRSHLPSEVDNLGKVEKYNST